MAADHAGAVREPVGMRPIGRAQQESGGVDRTTGDDNDVTSIPLRFTAALHHHFGCFAAAGAGLDALDMGAGQQAHIRVTQCRCDADDMRIGLGLHQARKPVAGRTTDARAVLRLLFVQHDADWQREGPMARTRQIIGQLPDARLVRHRGIRIGIAAGRLGRVAAALPVHMVESLGLRVVRREILIRTRPGRRHAVGMRQFAEISFPQAQQDGAVHLGVAADPVMDARVERLAVLVMPGLSRLVAVLGENRVGAPVFPHARQVIAAFEDQDALA